MARSDFPSGIRSCQRRKWATQSGSLWRKYVLAHMHDDDDAINGYVPLVTWLVLVWGLIEDNARPMGLLDPKLRREQLEL